MLDFISKAFMLLVALATASVLIFLTPLGGILNLVIGGIGFLGGGYCVLKALGMALDFKNWGYKGHLKEAAIWAALGLAGCAIFVVANLILPAPPVGNCSGEVVRSGYVRDCH